LQAVCLPLYIFSQSILIKAFTGGASGGILAARLAAANPSLSILLIEAGIDNKDNPVTKFPALMVGNLHPESQTIRTYVSKASKEVAGRKVVVQVGACLGGGSSVNFMTYWRPSALDYDEWDVEGWRAEDFIPALKKVGTIFIESYGYWFLTRDK
jgi:alcohol oxidase